MGFQTGGYIPGLSGSQFRGQLGSDIRQTQEDIEEQSGDIAKHERKRGWMKKAGSWLGEKGLQYGIGALTGPAGAAFMKSPLGKSLVKGAGAGLGQFIGGKAAGKGPEIKESSTGLLGGQYDTLKDIQRSNEEAQLGDAVKTGATRFLTAGAGDLTEDQLLGDAQNIMRHGTGDLSDSVVDEAGNLLKVDDVVASAQEGYEEVDKYFQDEDILGMQHGGNVYSGPPLFNPMSSHGAIDSLMDRNDMQSNYNDAIRRAEVMREVGYSLPSSLSRPHVSPGPELKRDSRLFGKEYWQRTLDELQGKSFI